MHFGLPKISSSIGSEGSMYGASSDCVIHSGISHDVTCVEISVNPRKSPNDVLNLEIDYKIAAEGVNLIEGHKIISGQDLYKEALR